MVNIVQIRRGLFALIILITLTTTACASKPPGVVETEAFGDHDNELKHFRSLTEKREAAAEQGHANAQFGLGVMYANGQGVRQDFGEAKRWYTLAAEQGYADAQYNLAVMHAQGQGVRQDFLEARRWLDRAVKQGHAQSQFALGVMYYNGDGVPQDLREAARWYTLAAEQGYANAQYNLGVIYDKGQGVRQDFGEAKRWYTLAAEQGHADAQYNLESLSAVPDLPNGQSQMECQAINENVEWCKDKTGVYQRTYRSDGTVLIDDLVRGEVLAIFVPKGVAVPSGCKIEHVRSDGLFCSY